MRPDVMLSHSHEASWRLASGLTPERRRLATEMLPVLQKIKRQLIVVGAAYFTDTDPRTFVAASHRLADSADAAVALLRVHLRERAGDVLLQDLLGEFTLLGIAARRIGPSTTLSAHVAEIRRSYGAIRALGSVLWDFEYIFEGNAQPMTASVMAASTNGGRDV